MRTNAFGHVGDAQVNDRALAGLQDFLVNFPGGLGHHFFDAGRVNAAIRDQLVHTQSRNLTADRVKTADDDGFWGVVHDELDTGGRLQGADVCDPHGR